MTKSRPIIRIDLASTVPVYRQIVDSLRMHLVEGDLVPGDVLPSVRRMAMELGITFNTVAQAYRQLAEEGWLNLKHAAFPPAQVAARSRDSVCVSTK